MKFWHASCVLEISMIVIYFVFKSKFVLVNAIKMYGCGGTEPLYLNLDTNDK